MSIQVVSFALLGSATRTDLSAIETSIGFRQGTLLYLQADGERRYRDRLMDYFGDRSLDSIDQAAIEEAALALCPNASESTRNRQVYGPVSTTIKFTASMGLCRFRKIKRPTQERRRTFRLTSDQTNKLIRASSRYLRPLIVAILFTDISPVQLLKLKWDQVDLKRGELRLRSAKLNGTNRVVILDQRVVAELSRLHERKGAVFRTPSGRSYSGKRPSIKTAFKAACRRAGIENLAPRDCRNVLGFREMMRDTNAP